MLFKAQGLMSEKSAAVYKAFASSPRWPVLCGWCCVLCSRETSWIKRCSLDNTGTHPTQWSPRLVKNKVVLANTFADLYRLIASTSIRAIGARCKLSFALEATAEYLFWWRIIDYIIFYLRKQWFEMYRQYLVWARRKGNGNFPWFILFMCFFQTPSRKERFWWACDVVIPPKNNRCQK